MALTGKQRAHLRGLAHHIDPVAMVGQAGITDAVIEKVTFELNNHELIKVRVSEAPEETEQAAPILAERTGAELVQIIGKMVVLYRRRKKDPQIRLPAADAAPKPRKAK